jgi:hypothetical protein
MLLRFHKFDSTVPFPNHPHHSNETRGKAGIRSEWESGAEVGDRRAPLLIHAAMLKPTRSLGAALSTVCALLMTWGPVVPGHCRPTTGPAVDPELPNSVVQQHNSRNCAFTGGVQESRGRRRATVPGFFCLPAHRPTLVGASSWRYLPGSGFYCPRFALLWFRSNSPKTLEAIPGNCRDSTARSVNLAAYTFATLTLAPETPFFPDVENHQISCSVSVSCLVPWF